MKWVIAQICRPEELTTIIKAYNALGLVTRTEQCGKQIKIYVKSEC